MQAVRVFGNNCKLQLKNRDIKEQDFAKALGYSTSDVRKLLDGRLLITEADEEEVARFFSVSADELYVDNSDQYAGKEFLHCMTGFGSKEDENTILDIFDMYCDLKEALAK